MSSEARAFLRAHKAPRLPILPLTPFLARLLRRAEAKGGGARLADLERRLTPDIVRHDANGIPVVEIVPQGRSSSADYAVYVHGGAYVIGQAHDAFGMLMADELRLPVVSIDYRLAPEAPFPAGLDDCVTAYSHLVSSRRGRCVLIGLSAGGGLVLALLRRIRELGLPEPAALGLITPWTDLTGAGDSHAGNARRDPLIVWRGLLDKAAHAYSGAHPPEDPLVSPTAARRWRPSCAPHWKPRTPSPPASARRPDDRTISVQVWSRVSIRE